MKKLIFTLLILIVPSVGFMACEDRGGGSGQTRDSASLMSNAELENSIKNRLDGDDQLKVANLKVDADRDRKIAMLYGTVETESLRSRAMDLARSAQPDVSIQDHLEVTPTEISRADHIEQMA